MPARLYDVPVTGVNRARQQSTAAVTARAAERERFLTIEAWTLSIGLGLLIAEVSPMRISTLLAVVGLTLLAPGCEDEEDWDPRERGDLGNGRFVYECLNETDSACTDGGAAVLPLAVAVGGRFDMLFDVSSGPQPMVIAPAGDFVRRVDRGFQVQREGEFALLAVNGNSEVIDLKHLRAAQTAEVRVQIGEQLPVARLALAEGQTVSLLAVPFDRQGVRLGGALAYAWRSSDESLLSFESISQLNRVRVRGHRAGTTTLVVEVAGTPFSVAVQVGAPISDAGVRTDAAVGGGIDAGPSQVDAATDAQTADGGVP
jgi:hypothetical protein